MNEQTTKQSFAPLDFSDFRQRLPAMNALDGSALVELTQILETWSRGLVETLAQDWEDREQVFVGYDKRIAVLRAYVELDNQIVNGIASLMNQRAKIVRNIERQYPELYNHEAKNEQRNTGTTEGSVQEPTAKKDDPSVPHT